MSALHTHALRAIAVDAALGKLPSAEVVEKIATALEDVLEDAGISEAEDIAGVIPDLRKEAASSENARQVAERDKEDAEEAHEKALSDLREELEKEKAEIARGSDELRARAEKAEHELGKARAKAKSGKKITAVMDAGAEERIAELNAALDRCEAKIRSLEEENARIKAAEDRAVEWYERRARSDVAETLSREVLAREEAEKKLEAALRETEAFRRTLAVAARATPEEARRLARLAVGTEIIEKSGTAAKEGYVPTRSERRRAKAAAGEGR